MRIKLIGVNVAFKFRRALTVLWLFAFSTCVLAQTVGGTMTGAVTDPSGAVIPGVTVTITNVENGTSRSMLTNETGVYRAVSLQPGTYNVTADLPGFSTGQRRNVAVNVGSEITVEFQLAIPLSLRP